MFSSEKSPIEKFPIGLPKKLEEKKEVLPAIEVANKIRWVNPDFPELPFDIKEGKSTKLGMFLTPKNENVDYHLEVKKGHGRSAILGRVIFKDRQGRFYRDVDLIGMGGAGKYESGRPVDSPQWLEVFPLRPKKNHSEGTHGILYEGSALKIEETSEAFLNWGIRTDRIIAIIDLDEVVDKKGSHISIEEAQKSNLLRNNERPVILVRAFGTKMRLTDINPESVEDARNFVASEFQLESKKFTTRRYATWLTETIARQIALIHNRGWYHGNLSMHNITLDGRITDLATAQKLNEYSGKENPVEKDVRDAQGALGVALYISSGMGNSILGGVYKNYKKAKMIRDNLLSLFKKVYSENRNTYGGRATFDTKTLF